MKSPLVVIAALILLTAPNANGQNSYYDDALDHQIDENAIHMDHIRLEFADSDLIVSSRYNRGQSFRITKDFDLHIGKMKVKTSLAQKGLLGQYYDTALEITEIVDDININGVTIDGGEVARLASEAERMVTSSMGDFIIPNLSFSLRYGLSGLAEVMEDLDDIMDEVSEHVEEMQEMMEENFDVGSLRGLVDEVDNIVDLMGELKDIQQALQRRIPEIKKLYWF